MGSTLLKIMLRYTLVLMLLMLVRGVLVNVTNEKDIKTYQAENISYSLNFESIDVIRSGLIFQKPIFNNIEINNYIDNYINKNSCSYLDYNIFEFADDYISVFLDCGHPNSKIFNYIKNKVYEINSFINDEKIFRETEIRLLSLKYPKFVVDDINFANSIYNLKDKEIVGYYETKTFGPISVKINNNEIKNLMNYNMKYDTFYENEKYTLDVDKKTVAFTFDDGPSYYDIEISKYLKENHSKATFFIVGNRVGNYKEVIKILSDTNMEVGNHTYSHKQLTSISNTQITEQINKTNKIYYELTGSSMSLYRPPYGAINNRVLNLINMPSILWSLDTLDWKYRDADKVYDAIINEVEDGDIILMHSLYPTTLEAVKRAVPELYKRGYQIVSVSELAKIKSKPLVSNSSYLMLN